MPPPRSAGTARHLCAEEAARLVKPGDHVFIGTASATPRTMVRALEALKSPPADVEMIHFLSDGALRVDDQGRVSTAFRHRAFFVGAEMRAAVLQGVAEYVPVPIARVPELMRKGRIRVDVAIVQVTPPDAFGYVSLGVSVDVAAAAIECAKLVIAEVNPALPWTMGDSTLHIGKIDCLVDVAPEVPEYHHPPTDDQVVHRIARYIAGTIDDGSTLQIGMGRIPQEALRYLDDRRDLGIHSDVITDAILPLLDKGILTGEHKTQHRGKIVCSFAFGSRRLYETVDRNALFSFQPIEAVCHPYTISAQHRMVSVTQVFAIDLTGQACSDQFAGEFYGGIAAQGDFLRGASRSAGGKAILCLASTTDDASVSRIRPQLLEGEGVSIARSDVHYVITEYGIAYLFGKSVRERAIAMIELAHPGFRPWLLEQAKALGLLPPEQTLQNMRAYPVEDERSVTLKNGRVVMLRPARASDANSIRDLFFKLPDGDIYTRFFRRVRALSSDDIRRLCNYNQESEVGFVATVGTRDNETIVGQCCYFVNPSSNTAETAFLVDPEWQGCGLGSAMQRRLAEHAQARGLRGFTAEILPQNAKMLALARGGDGDITVERDEDSVIITALF
ncbi:bifunctional acetyl-CoA hydrolase/transferase family protein/GNAT family N-acetyltransferase [uncultured Piscinibacter sp.]|uniref:bifunctional acetyl-CoA hydrolase/transferase family protein/GNAT family N-acetyltransferase n=1 Tax=uncultured Piscinibacter sp. TaxID=1131835 RepID=UPI002638DE4E|nr:bifunctional acetyl-CoA hydrolase/transferase family protein/GNAT family N-acetyltransferase [uncultured Piscinibacter sp.]